MLNEHNTGVSWGIHKFGHLKGFQMIFIDPGKFSVCEEFKDYLLSIVPEGYNDKWAWVSTEKFLEPYPLYSGKLIKFLRGIGFSVAFCVTGERRFIPPVDWLCVKTVSSSQKILQPYGNELISPYEHVKGIAGIKDLSFFYKYLYQGPPIYTISELSKSFLKANPSWSLDVPYREAGTICTL